MAIICVKLLAEGKLASHIPQSPPHLSALQLVETADEGAHKMGDYRDILSLTRVLVHGPESKSDVDIVIERYATFI